MDWIIIIEMIAAISALTGMFCLAKYLSDTFFLPKEVVTAVTIFDEESRKNADILIHILKKGMWRWGNRRVCVIVSERYVEDRELMDMISASACEYFIVK